MQDEPERKHDEPAAAPSDPSKGIETVAEKAGAERQPGELSDDALDSVSGGTGPTYTMNKHLSNT